MAGASLTAQYTGAGRQDLVNHVAGQTMIMVAITSVILGALGYCLAPYLLSGRPQPRGKCSRPPVVAARPERARPWRAGDARVSSSVHHPLSLQASRSPQ